MASPDPPATTATPPSATPTPPTSDRTLRIVLVALPVVCLTAAGLLFFKRLQTGADLLSVWPEAAAFTLALAALIPETLRARWRVALLIVSVFLVAVSLLAVTPPRTGLQADVITYEEVLPREPVVFTVSGISAPGRLAVELLIEDHDPDLLSTELCQNEIKATVTTDGGASGSTVPAEPIGQARHRFVVPVTAGEDLRLTVTYQGPSPASDCSEDVRLDSFVVE
jgi:hypothetical protein